MLLLLIAEFPAEPRLLDRGKAPAWPTVPPPEGLGREGDGLAEGTEPVLPLLPVGVPARPDDGTLAVSAEDGFCICKNV